jgi:hypothetical protein
LQSLPPVSERFSCFYMFERTLTQVHLLCLYFFFSNLFDDSLYTIHDFKHEGCLSQGLVVFVHGREGRSCQSMLRCTMVRSVSSQERRQITVTLFLLLHPLSIIFFFQGSSSYFPTQRASLFYFIVFIMTFITISSYREKNF